MKIEEIRNYIDRLSTTNHTSTNERKNFVTTTSSKRDIFWWIELLLFQILVSQIFLGLYMVIDVSILSPLFLIIFIESIILSITVSLLLMRKKSGRLEKFFT